MPRELHPYAILLRPLITEKSTSLAGQDKYVFEVDLRANKPQIREAVELAFNVTVRDVNTMVVKGKNRRFAATSPSSQTGRRPSSPSSPATPLNSSRGFSRAD